MPGRGIPERSPCRVAIRSWLRAHRSPARSGGDRRARDPEHDGCDGGYAPADARSSRPPRRARRGRRAACAAGRARLLTRLVRLGRPVERSGDVPRRVAREGIGGPRPTQALPTRAPRPDARADLLGVPDPAHHDRRGRWASWSTRPSSSPLIGGTRWLGLIQDVFAARRAGRDRDRGRHPRVPAPRALRREPPAGGLPDPRPDLPGSSSRCSSRGAHGSPRATRRTRGGRPCRRPRRPCSPGCPTGWQRASMWTFQWVHIAIILGFLVYLGYSKHLHIATSAINVYFASTRPRGTLTPLRIDLESAEAEDVHLGAATITDLTWKQTARPLRVHRVRALPERVPGVEHGQAALAQAPGHEPARPPASSRARGSWRPKRPAPSSSRSPSCPRSSTRRSCGPARRAAPACRSARSTSSTSTRSSTCAATS